MVNGPTTNVLSAVRFLAASWRDDERPDAELVRSFAADRDERAFTTLVGRHGPLVWGVCRKVLGGGPDAEDAFQATFLALARKCPRVRAGSSLAGWLYLVARRTALK